MTPAQKDTLIYIRNGILQILAIVAFAFIFAHIVTERDTPAEPVPAEPQPECTACGCTTVTKSITVAGTAL